jgi:hypothetical protein
MAIASANAKERRLIKLLQSKINILNPLELTATPQAEQRVSKEQQRAINDTPILTIPQITDAPTYNASQESYCKGNPEKYTAASPESHSK